MQKQSWVFLIAAVLGVTVGSCKKDSTNTTKPLGNNPHTLDESYYMRAKFDTTWTYIATSFKNEDTLITNASALLYAPYDNRYLTFVFLDSSSTSPQDTTIIGWAGKYFSYYNYADTSRPYMFKLLYKDGTGAKYSTEYTDNRSSNFSIDSVIADGSSTLTFDSLGQPYRLFKIKGSLSCNMAPFNDSSKVIHVTQGVYSVRIRVGSRR